MPNMQLKKHQIELVEFYQNTEVNLKSGEAIELNLGTEFNSIDTREILLTIEISIFNEDYKEHEKPFYIHLKSSTRFEIDEDLDEQEKIHKYGANMILLSFPFARTYITNLTAMAGISPITIPILSIKDILG